MNSFESLMYSEVAERLGQMSGMKTTDEAYKATTDATTKLIDRAIKMRETDIKDREAELKERELELQAKANELKEKELEETRLLKEQEIKEAHKSGVRDCIVQIGKIVVPPIIAGCLAVGLTVYERTDVVTGTAVKEIWKRVFRLT